MYIKMQLYHTTVYPKCQFLLYIVREVLIKSSMQIVQTYRDLFSASLVRYPESVYLNAAFD